MNDRIKQAIKECNKFTKLDFNGLKGERCYLLNDFKVIDNDRQWISIEVTEVYQANFFSKKKTRTINAGIDVKTNCLEY